jgi:hypothetical protein
MCVRTPRLHTVKVAADCGGSWRHSGDTHSGVELEVCLRMLPFVLMAVTIVIFTIVCRIEDADFAVR